MGTDFVSFCKIVDIAFDSNSSMLIIIIIILIYKLKFVRMSKNKILWRFTYCIFFS